MLKYVRVEITPEESLNDPCKGCAHDWDRSKIPDRSEAGMRCLKSICAEWNPETGAWTDYKFIVVDS